MPIHDYIVLVLEGGEMDGIEFVAFFTITSLRHPIFFHYLIIFIGEAIEPTIFLEIVTHVLKVWGTNIQNGFITHEDLDEELAGLHEIYKKKL